MLFQTVMLNSGGPPMLVIDQVDGMCMCAWDAYGKVATGTFLAVCLTVL